MDQKQPKSLGDQITDVRAKYQAWLKTITHDDPATYEQWLEIEVIRLENIIKYHRLPTDDDNGFRMFRWQAPDGN